MFELENQSEEAALKDGEHKHKSVLGRATTTLYQHSYLARRVRFEERTGKRALAGGVHGLGTQAP